MGECARKIKSTPPNGNKNREAVPETWFEQRNGHEKGKSVPKTGFKLQNRNRNGDFVPKKKNMEQLGDLCSQKYYICRVDH